MKRRPTRASRGRIRTLLLVAVLAVTVGVFVQGLRNRMGVDRAPVTYGVENCTLLTAPAGPEDVAIDDRTGVAYVSALNRRDPGAQGDLWMLDLAAEQPELSQESMHGSIQDSLQESMQEFVRLERDGPVDFRPHGLSLLRIDDTLRLFVVNHPQGRHTIEVFAIEDGRARHLTTIGSDALISPNDVAAVDETRFYVSNDHGTTGGVSRLMEDLLGLNMANVLYFDGERFVEAISGLSYANGVTLAQDGAQLVVAEVFARGITFYDREPMSGRVAPHLLVELDSGVDNLTVSADGAIWIAGHPRLLDFAAHARDASARSATEVFRVERSAQGTRFDRVLSDDGALLPGGSVAAAWRDRLLVSGVFEPRMLRCVLDPEFAAGPPLAPGGAVGPLPDGPVPAAGPAPAGAGRSAPVIEPVLTMDGV